MSRFCLILSWILLIIAGVGCSGLQPTPLPSQSIDYLPTLVQLTMQAGLTATATPTRGNTPADFPPVSPTSTPAPATAIDAESLTPSALNQTSTSSPTPSLTSTLELSTKPVYRPTRTPTITPTPTLPVAGVQFVMPGPMSRVSSPLHLIANLRSVPSGNYHVDLLIEPLEVGGEARALYREVERIISNPIPWVYLDQEIQFELNRVSEFGQLRLSTYDTYGRMVSVNSVDLLLLSMGVSSITPVSWKTEPIILREPTPNQLIQGGKVIVSGLVKPGEDFLLVELVAADGTIPGYRQVYVTPSPDGSYVPYAVEVPYSVQAATWVRLQISESSTRIPGIEHLTSLQVLLSP